MNEGEWSERYEANEKKRNERALELVARYPGGAARFRADYKIARKARARLERELERAKREEGRCAEVVRRACGIELLHVDTENADAEIERDLAEARERPAPFDPFGDDASSQ